MDHRNRKKNVDQTSRVEVLPFPVPMHHLTGVYAFNDLSSLQNRKRFWNPKHSMLSNLNRMYFKPVVKNMERFVTFATARMMRSLLWMSQWMHRRLFIAYHDPDLYHGVLEHELGFVKIVGRKSSSEYKGSQLVGWIFDRVYGLASFCFPFWSFGATRADVIDALVENGAFGNASLSRGSPVWWKRHRLKQQQYFQGMAAEKRAKEHQQDIQTILQTTPNDPEEFRLMLEEAVFLQMAFGCIAIESSLCLDSAKDHSMSLVDFWQYCCQYRNNALSPGHCEFAVLYAVYHYYRSIGWVVKTGHLFGTDYVLYRKGPSHRHSDYAVIVEPVYANKPSKHSFRSLKLINRVSSRSKKVWKSFYSKKTRHC